MSSDPSGEQALESIQPDSDYGRREGYNPMFLGLPVALPTLSPEARTKAVIRPGLPEPDAYELKYHHFSIIMNGKARLAFVTAVNHDGAAAFRHTREGSDRWFFDPRLDVRYQAGEEFYTGNPLDRGHLVRRADAAWGSSADEAKKANDDTFHFTNCSPQHEIFNQAAKATKQNLLLWGNIEAYIARQASTGRERLTIFSGPVFRPNDRPYRGLLLPKEFWKIVVYTKPAPATAPAAVAFILSQEGLIGTLPLEDFAVGPYRPFQVKIHAIETRTHLNFGSLRASDPLESGGFESLFVPGSEAVPLAALDDIVL